MQFISKNTLTAREFISRNTQLPRHHHSPCRHSTKITNRISFHFKNCLLKHRFHPRIQYGNNTISSCPYFEAPPLDAIPSLPQDISTDRLALLSQATLHSSPDHPASSSFLLTYPRKRPSTQFQLPPTSSSFFQLAPLQQEMKLPPPRSSRSQDTNFQLPPPAPTPDPDPRRYLDSLG